MAYVLFSVKQAQVSLRRMFTRTIYFCAYAYACVVPVNLVFTTYNVCSDWLATTVLSENKKSGFSVAGVNDSFNEVSFPGLHEFFLVLSPYV